MKLLEVTSSDVEKLLMQVFVLQKMGYPEIALQKCLNSINCDEDNEDVVIFAAELYIEANALQEAYDLLSSSGLRYPDSLNIDVVRGEVCMQLGHKGEAIKRFSKVIDEMPSHKQAVLNLTRILIDIGDFQSACNTLDKWIAANDRDQWAYIISASMLDYFGRPDLAAAFLSRAEKMLPESLHLPYLMMAVSDGKIPERAPLGHLRELFDETANGYDAHLKAIGNAGPRHIAEVIEHLDLREPKTYSILDAGCGTGLCGVVLKPHAGWLEGIDLSPKMLEQAKSRGCYDNIECCDIVEFSHFAVRKYDLIVLSDVFVYFGALHEILNNLSRCLSAGGHIAFSVEALIPVSGIDLEYRLAANGRYSHTLAYVLKMLGEYGFSKPSMIKHDILRYEFGKPVNCIIIVASIGEIK